MFSCAALRLAVRFFLVAKYSHLFFDFLEVVERFFFLDVNLTSLLLISHTNLILSHTVHMLQRRRSNKCSALPIHDSRLWVKILTRLLIDLKTTSRVVHLLRKKSKIDLPLRA